MDKKILNVVEEAYRKGLKEGCGIKDVKPYLVTSQVVSHELIKPILNELETPFTEPYLTAVINRLCCELNKNIEDLFIEGLKRKGFEFENRMELDFFIKLCCRCEDNVDLKQRTYFVNDIPFFLHCYEIEMDLNPITNDREFKFSANYGSYTYL